ncbi:MAG: hypothetical protein OXU81_04660, partial [Gammaproteobacteria bacterium]|nr:hypothetical protein [Gammaproteobacteria bacterium]
MPVPTEPPAGISAARSAPERSTSRRALHHAGSIPHGCDAAEGGGTFGWRGGGGGEAGDMATRVPHRGGGVQIDGSQTPGEAVP